MKIIRPVNTSVRLWFSLAIVVSMCEYHKVYFFLLLIVFLIQLKLKRRLRERKKIHGGTVERFAQLARVNGDEKTFNNYQTSEDLRTRNSPPSHLDFKIR